MPPGSLELLQHPPTPHAQAPRSQPTRAPHPAGGQPSGPVTVPAPGQSFAASEHFTPGFGQPQLTDVSGQVEEGPPTPPPSDPACSSPHCPAQTVPKL